MADHHRSIGSIWRGLGLDEEVFPLKKLPTRASDFVVSPFDMFVVVGILIEDAAIYRHVFAADEGTQGWYGLAFTPEIRQEVVGVGKEWREEWRDGRGHTPEKVFEWWQALFKLRGQSLTTEDRGAQPPDWWWPAVKLFIAADEAARGTDWEMNSFFADGLGNEGDGFHAVDSFSLADLAVARVLPKQQTPAVGCSMRSLSMHLALVRAGGELAVDWTFSAPGEGAQEKLNNADNRSRADSLRPLNVILVPWPFEVPATAFQTTVVAASAFDPHATLGERAPWGWFDLSSEWCSPKLSSFLAYVDGLIEATRRSAGPVHGIVFPELSLSWETFEALALHLKKDKDIEMLIAGSSEAAHSKSPGNHVHGAYFRLHKDGDVVLTSRAKHHRWKLTKDQIRAYSLGASLDPAMDWWEHIELGDREVNFVSLRPDLVVTTMICEDLARIDPCQYVLRATGPSLIIALLMDGPQMASRWPGRYATILADDPGSAVLTFTSLGLLERQNASGHHEKPSRKIALWKDEVTGFREIELPMGADAVCITISPTQTTDRSIDGRTDTRLSLSLSGITPIKGVMPRP